MSERELANLLREHASRHSVPATASAAAIGSGFSGRGAGNTERVFRWRYALLGWLAWAIGKRMLRRKLRVTGR